MIVAAVQSDRRASPRTSAAAALAPSSKRLAAQRGERLPRRWVRCGQRAGRSQARHAASKPAGGQERLFQPQVARLGGGGTSVAERALRAPGARSGRARCDSRPERGYTRSPRCQPAGLYSRSRASISRGTPELHDVARRVPGRLSAAVVAEPRPGAQHVGRRRGRQRGGRRPALEPRPVALQHARDLGLLQHDLADEDCMAAGPARDRAPRRRRIHSRSSVLR